MNISNIEQYVAQTNSYRTIFGQAELSLLNAADRQTIANRIENDLSPENLTCDGELSRSAVNARAKLLYRAAEELAAIDPTIVFCDFI
jgi:hypothetical protein